MKSLNSVKRKIGAFLAAALIATLLPTAGVLAADEENLIVNGDFSDVTALTEDKEYKYGDVTATIAKDSKIPNNWDISVQSSLVAMDTVFINGTNKFVSFKGTGFSISQVVSGIEAGAKYKLSLDVQTVTRGAATVDWMNSEDKTISSTVYKAAKMSSSVLYGYEYNFVAPTDAVKMKFSFCGDGISTNQFASIDNVKLVKGGVEYLNDGGFENVYDANGNPVTWSGADLTNSKGTTEKAASGSYSLKISASNKSVYQDISVIPGNWYKLSYKYAQENRQDGANLAPNISVAYQNAPSGADAVEASTVQTASADGSWNDGVVYFYAPAVESKAAMTVRVTLATHTESGFAGAVYFDDVSVTQTTAGDASNADMNLLKNGSFKSTYAIESDITYGTTTTHTHTAGTLYPKYWNIGYNESDTTASGALVSVNGNSGYINFSGTAFNVYQDVTGLEAGQLYSLTWLQRDNSADGRSVGKVEFMHYDGTTMKPLATWASENGKTLVKGRMLGSVSNGDITSVDTMCYIKNGVGKLNFVIPPYANAVRVTLQANSIGVSSGGTNRYVQISDVSLKRTDEYVNNGEADLALGHQTQFTLGQWYQGYVQEGGIRVSSVTQTNQNKIWATATQRFLMNTGKMFKISFKYMYDSVSEDGKTDPVVYVYPYDNELEYSRKLFIGCTAKKTQEAGKWTEYVGYFYIPELPVKYPNGVANMVLELNVADTTSGNFYYDDVSIKQVEETKLGFTYSAKGLYDVQDFAEDGASNAAVIYVQDTDSKSNTFYAAKYDAETDELLDVQLAEIGSDMKAGDSGFKAFNFGQLEGENQNVYYRVFLWNNNMVPTMSSVRYN